MKPQQLLVQLDRLDGEGVGVAFNRPGQEFLRGRKDRAIGLQNKGVLRLRDGSFTQGVEGDRVVHQKIVQRRPIRRRHRPFDQQVLVLGNRRSLQHVGIRERLLELPVRLLHDPRQRPGSDIVARGRLGFRPLHNPPAVHLEIVPVPVRQNGVHYWLHLLRRVFNRLPHPHDPLFGFIALDVAFQHDLEAHGPDRLRPSLILLGRGNDRIEMLDGRFR